MVKGIIFDMDGVVFDTERLSTMGWLKCGEELGIELDMKFINSFKGTARSYSRRLLRTGSERILIMTGQETLEQNL